MRSSRHIDPQQAAEAVAMLVCDVDGTLTDGRLFYDGSGQVGKFFNSQDGLGVKLAQKAGLEVGVISGRGKDGGEQRIRELGVVEFHCGFVRKLPVIEEICKRRGLTLSQIAFIGDDWVDADAMLAVGLPMAVADSQPEILEIASWTSSRGGGRGAVREAINFILKAQGKLDKLWEDWLNGL